MNNTQNSSIRLIIEIALVFVSLAVIGWAVFLALDFKEVVDRDNKRIAMMKGVQDSLENFYRVNNYYPGSPYQDENKLVIYADWHYLITTPEMKDYYDFSEFKDPCQPERAVDIKGAIKCPSIEINYLYMGVNCKEGCSGYKLVIELEKGGKQEFSSETLYKRAK